MVASGTEIIDRLGAEMSGPADRLHVSRQRVSDRRARGSHPGQRAYRMRDCVRLVALDVGRVIARPFVGTAGSFHRTANRHDYALTPPRDTLLDLPTRQGPRVSIGKVGICSPAEA